MKIIIYDFDGTLTKDTLPKFKIIEKCGFKDGSYNPQFLGRVKETQEKEEIDLYKAFYKVYLEVIKENGLKLIDENFCVGSSIINYNLGVIPFLKKLKANGIKNYILSSGIKVFLNKTKIAPLVEDVYATTFIYNQNNEVDGINFLMNDKNKVEAIKEICTKNGYKETDCSNIIYIGDGFTDYYAMEYVKNNGGITILVYNDSLNKEVFTMQEKGVVSITTLADYSINSELHNYVSKICNLK